MKLTYLTQPSEDLVFNLMFYIYVIFVEELGGICLRRIPSVRLPNIIADNFKQLCEVGPMVIIYISRPPFCD